MSTVLEQLTKKIEATATTTVKWVDENHIGHNGEQLSRRQENIVTTIGKIYEEDLFESESLIAVLDIEDPRVYKQIFNLDNKGGLAIEKSLKSLLIEVKDSLCTFYYILGDSCLSIEFICKYQRRETIREVPLSLISYLRVLCGKKAPIEIAIEDDFIYIKFEDSIVKDTTPKPKLKKGEKREKEVGKKYVLELPLSDIDALDSSVVELFKEVSETDKEDDLEDRPLPIDLSNILYNKEPLQLYKYKVEISRGKLRYITTDGLLLNVVVCPVEIAKHYRKEDALYEFDKSELIPEDVDEEDTDFIEGLNRIADTLDAYMIGEEINE